MIRGNGWGIAMVVVGGVLGGMGSYFLKLKDSQALIILGAAWVLMDMIVRLRSRYQPRWLLNRQAGGFIWHIPVWIFGLIILLINTVLIATS